MNLKPLFWTIGIILLFALLWVLWSIFGPTSAPPSQGGESGRFPIVSSTPSGTSGGEGGQTTALMVVAARGTGASIEVNDFIHNGTTVEDVQNPGTYYLAGNLGYCLKDGVCPSGMPADNYKVAYDAKNQFFTIALTDEPISQARLSAEQFLRQTLGISNDQLCALNYYVGTTSYVNSVYAGKNLGFSFCPGATALP